MIAPDRDDFAKLAASHSMVPVYRRLVGDTLTPVTAFCRIREGSHAFLFESVVGGERVGRYSFLGSRPFSRFEATRDHVMFDGQVSQQVDPLKALEGLLRKYDGAHLPGLPRFLGGAVGFVGYDAVRYVEELPNAPEDDRGLPDLSFAFYDRMVIFDHVDKTILVVVHAQSGGYDDACRKIDELVGKLASSGGTARLADINSRSARRDPKLTSSNFTQERFEAAVVKAQKYIHAGDVFQVVLSQRFRTETNADPFDIYRALRVVSPSPFMFFVAAGEVVLVGASPEIMCRVEDGEVTNRPLAGTRKRGSTPEADSALAFELENDPKERAEHIMLVDLARNDVGRVARTGSIRIRDLLTVERYSHVMHLSSTVTGRLGDGLTAFDALRAALPAGTLSGAPKVRAMEIIDELEPHRRGPYGGAVGYIDFAGNMDTCIALRTMVVRDGIADVQAGAGIVGDSVPSAEFQETINKSLSLLTALAVAEEQLRES